LSCQSERSDLNRGHRSAGGRIGRSWSKPGAMPTFATF